MHMGRAALAYGRPLPLREFRIDLPQCLGRRRPLGARLPQAERIALQIKPRHGRDGLAGSRANVAKLGCRRIRQWLHSPSSGLSACSFNGSRDIAFHF